MNHTHTQAAFLAARVRENRRYWRSTGRFNNYNIMRLDRCNHSTRVRILAARFNGIKNGIIA